MADKVLDTSDLTVHELRRAFRELSQGDGKQTRLTVTLLSFGYKYGVPPNQTSSSMCGFCPTRTL